MPILDASALDTDPDGLEFLRAVLKPAATSTPGREPKTIDEGVARTPASRRRARPAPNRRPRGPSPVTGDAAEPALARFGLPLARRSIRGGASDRSKSPG